MLPDLRTQADVDAWLDDGSAVESALTEVGRFLGYAEPPECFDAGSVPVAAYGDRVVKLFPPSQTAYAQTEHAALVGLDGALPVPTPRPLGTQVIDGWTAVAMSRLVGRELVEIWDDLPPPVRLDLGRQVGEMTAALHAHPPPAAIPRVDWAAWVGERSATVATTQAQRGCPASLVADIPRFLDQVDLHAGPTGWLHTEIMLEHLLATPVEGGWRLSGLFDFEPSWVGPVDYELASLGLFVAQGDPEVFRAVLEGMGREISDDLPQRTMGMALMHRYCNLGWYVRRLGSPAAPATLTDVAWAWFSTRTRAS